MGKTPEERLTREHENLIICGALRDLVPFVQFKKVKNTHGGVLILVTLQAVACN